MSDRIEFRIKARKIEYGDRPYYEYRILFVRRGKIVGVEDGPRRVATDRASALEAARARVDVLEDHRLFVIRVTDKHIRDGEEGNCNTCAIAQALWHNQVRMGLSRDDWNFRVEPYGFFTDSRGIVLTKGTYYREDAVYTLPTDDLPDIVGFRSSADRCWPEGMVEWAFAWDNWAEARGMTRKQWKEHDGWSDDGKPPRPGPSTFVLDLDAFVVESAT